MGRLDLFIILVNIVDGDMDCSMFIIVMIMFFRACFSMRPYCKNKARNEKYNPY